eukprot:EG_transcript_14177
MGKDRLRLPLLPPTVVNPRPSPCTAGWRRALPPLLALLLLLGLLVARHAARPAPPTARLSLLLARPPAGAWWAAASSSSVARRHILRSAESSNVAVEYGPIYEEIPEETPPPPPKFQPPDMTDQVPVAAPAVKRKKLLKRLGRFTLMEVPNSKEVNDPVLQDVAADLIRQIVMAFFTHPRSPYYTDPKRFNLPEIRRKQFSPSVEEALPINFPPDLPGLETLPSRIAFAIYVRGKPGGVAVVIERMVDHGDSLTIAVTLATENDYLRHLMIGKKYHTNKLLTATVNQQLSLAYERPVTAVVGVIPVKDWGRRVGGIWKLMPY